MGLFSSTKTKRTYKFRPLIEEPLKKYKYGNSNKLKNNTEKQFTHNMLQNHIYGLSNRDNMKKLMYDANRVYDKPIMFKEDFAQKRAVEIRELASNKVWKYMRNTYLDYNSGISFSKEFLGNKLYLEYVLSMQLDSYDTSTHIGTINGYTLKFQSNFLRVKVVDIDLTIVSTSSDITLNSIYGIEVFGLVIDVEEYLIKLFKYHIFKQLNIELSPAIIKEKDSSYEIISIATQLSSNPKISIVTLQAEVTYVSAIFNGTNIYASSIVNSSFEVKTKLLVLQEDLDVSEEALWVKYKDTNNRYKIVHIPLLEEFLSKRSKTIRVSARLDIKGNTHSKKQEKYWKKALELNGYMSKRKHQPNEHTDKESTKDLYTQLQDEDKIESFSTQMIMYFAPFMNKNIRHQRNWQLYLKAFFTFFEKYCKYSKDIRVAQGYVLEIPSTESAYRIKVAKKIIKNHKIKKRCFISTEPEYIKPCLYLNIPNYSKNGSNQYFSYTQYILDLDFFFSVPEPSKGRYVHGTISFLNTSDQNPSYEMSNNSDRRYKRVSTVDFNIATKQDEIEFMNSHGQAWFNDGERDFSEITVYSTESKKSSGVGSSEATYSLIDTKQVYTHEEYINEFGSILNGRDIALALIDIPNESKKRHGYTSHHNLEDSESVEHYAHLGIDTCIYPIDTTDGIPPEFDPMSGKDDERDAWNSNNYLKMFYPPMPVLLWFRVAYVAQLDICPSVIWSDYLIKFKYKKQTFLGKIFGLILIVIGVLITKFFPPLAKFGMSLVYAGIGTIVQQMFPNIKWLNLLITTIGFLYGNGFSLDTILTNLTNNTIVTIPQLLGVTSSVYNYILTARVENLAEDTQKELKEIEEEEKELAKKREEEGLSNPMFLNTFDKASEDFMSEIDRLYALMYGEAIYGENAHDILYQTNPSIMDYERFK